MSTHIVVLHRWRDGHARYEDYLDHAHYRVSYVTTELGLASVPATAAAVRVVGATDDVAQVWPAVVALAARYGPPKRLVALNEGDLDTAAVIREHLGCAGQNTEQLARFRDKLVMVRTVSERGVPVPAFADAPNRAAVEQFADLHGWPVVVKPRKGTASRGVLVLRSSADLDGWDELAPEPRLVETFCDGDILHIDGLWTGTDLGPWRASRYLNTCVDFTHGEALGSVEVDDADLLAALADFTSAAAGALSSEPWVFHLEVFLTSPAGEPPRFTFLEAGYRVGGAEIPFVWREVHGIDLMRAAADVQLGRSPRLPVPDHWQTAGWLLVPTPVPAPCRVLSWELPEPPTPGEGPYASVIPPVGGLIPRVGGYEHVGARFRFRGNSSGEVEKAVTRTASQFRLRCRSEAEVAAAAGTAR
jgi:biotin carboxylase